MIQIQQIKLRPDHTREDLERKIRRELGLKDSQPLQYRILRQSVDAHKRPDLFLVYTVELSLPNETAVLKRCRKNSRVVRSERTVYRIPRFSGEGKNEGPRPVIIGAGPAGLFCAYLLAHAGLRPLILERGGSVEERSEDVARFWETGLLDPESNVQFGEGGAGAFSDGKLNSAIKDPDGRVRFVLETFASFGADPSVCYSYKPHVGTDVLSQVLLSIRSEIERLGGTYRFHCRVDRILPVKETAETIETAETGTEAFRTQVSRTQVSHTQAQCWQLNIHQNGKDSVLYASTVVLAIGHSARDTYAMLQKEGLPMEAKSFAVGLRVMHPQKWINDAMYGKDCAYDFGAAPYKLTHRAESGRGVYSFCMCPGGYVVNASSEEGMLAVNGMSYHDRAGENANSAIVVTVSPEDYAAWNVGKALPDPKKDSQPDPQRDTKNPLAGIVFQRMLEKKAYEAGSGMIPVQRFEDYENRQEETESTGPGEVAPSIKGAWKIANVHSILPETLTEAICEGMHAFGKKISGFDHPDTLLCGVESRTSSPVRIRRGETFEAEAFPGLYPCGEGAGYAGGITSAAVDGMKVAEAIIHRFENGTGDGSLSQTK